MHVRIMTFAQLREQLGAVLEIELADGATVAILQQHLNERYPDVKALAVSRLAVNREYVVDPEQVLADQDEVALIPPVSGG